MSEHTVFKTSYFLVYGALLALLLLTVGAAYIDLGRLTFPFGNGRGDHKAVSDHFDLHARPIRGAAGLGGFAAAAFFWLAILLPLTLSDSFTRNLLGIAGK